MSKPNVHMSYSAMSDETTFLRKAMISYNFDYQKKCTKISLSSFFINLNPRFFLVAAKKIVRQLILIVLIKFRK